MLTRELALNQMPEYPFDKEYDINRIVFFDIETTGLSAETSYLYLIGCAYCKDGAFRLIQWFSEDIREEKLLLITFFEFLKQYDVLIHYNGSGFDIPFLQHKITALQLEYSFDTIKSLDIYRSILPYKKLLNLNNLKLKTLEAFLNIRRMDELDGGELISVYQSYLGRKKYEALKKHRNPGYDQGEPSKAEALLQQLLLHNEEDILGLLLISPILSYAECFENPIRILQAGMQGGVLRISFEVSPWLPVRINYRNDPAVITALGKAATLTVQTYEGELKHYYENYKDYYYLPAEDCAIHKSVAQFVDKAYRVKAKPSNCYTKKQGIFAPQYDKLLTPYFKINYEDKLTFLEVHTDFLLREDNLELYVRHMLHHML